jgi:polygalacturonase
VRFDVTEFGATGDGETLDTAAIQAAIDACADAGGGTAVVPPGEYVTAPVFLRSNVELHLAPGATLLGCTSFEEYPTVESRDGGVEREMYAALVTAEDEHNVAVTGRGTIDGRGEAWWEPYREDSARFDELGLDREDQYPPPEGITIEYPRPRLINLIDCEDVLLRDLTLRNSPCWTVHPLYCENVTIENLSIFNPEDSPNTDGINPDSCRNVRIEGCHLDVGDDCVTLKSGYDEDGLRVDEPLENVLVTGCTMELGHGGVVIGSEMSGDVRNVAVTNCVFDRTYRGLRIKTTRGRGGVVENVRATNLVMRDVQKEALKVSMHYEREFDIDGGDPESETSGAIPRVEDIHYSDITVDGVRTAGAFLGLPEQHVRNVSLSNVRIRNAAEGLSVERASGVTLSDVEIDTAEGPALEADGVDALDVDRLVASSPDAPVMRLNDVSHGFVRGCPVPEGAAVFVDDPGGTSDITFGANRRSDATEKRRT